MYKKLDIKNPCTQKWDEMQPMGTGRHCGSCNHVIHDFSKMNNNELLQMLQSGKYSCGMFTKDQMGMLYMEKGRTSGRKKYWSALAASIIAGTLQLTVSYAQSPIRRNHAIVDDRLLGKDPQEKTETTIPEKETVKKEKFSFLVVDAETNGPLKFAQVEMMNHVAYTDSLGRVDFEFEYQEGQRMPFVVRSYLYTYEEKKMHLNLFNCFKKLTTIRLKTEKIRRKKENYILGLWA